LNRDGNDNSILYKFTHSGRQKAIVAAEFSRFKRSRVFEASFSTLSAMSGRSTAELGGAAGVYLERVVRHASCTLISDAIKAIASVSVSRAISIVPMGELLL